MSLPMETSDTEKFQAWQLKHLPQGNSQIYPDHSASQSPHSTSSVQTMLNVAGALEREKKSNRDLLYRAATLQTQLQLAEARFQWVKKDYEKLCRAVNSKAVSGYWPSSPRENPYTFRWSLNGDTSPLEVKYGCGCSATIDPSVLTPPPYTPASPIKVSAMEQTSMPPPPKRKADLPLGSSTAKRAVLHTLATDVPTRPTSPKAMFSPVTPTAFKSFQ
ncbi:hypothetical protein BKA61DRAFT_656558 [Leptodontidium sp. MPI-SDFR-AT-0119]|nr:hypothetical protein BKA61DRAFT_656558 [Leptodontidium sp. MPI-SDFR-AT-0119]